MQKDDSKSVVVSFSDQDSPIKYDKKRLFLSRLKRKILKHTWVVRVFILAAIVLGLYMGFLFLGRVAKQSGIFYYTDLARDFIFTPGDKVKSQNGRTTILILGKGGQGHEAPDLTDTMMVASVDQHTSSVTLVSLPRDIWIPDLRTKLNSVYYWGNKKKEHGGLLLAKASVEEIVGQPVHYGIVIDFSGFKKVIDIVGGIEVDVERSFTDERYPVPGRENDLCGGDSEYKCRYETIRFEKGIQHMDGETALKFVRSRNADGDEGTDFARAARQQRVISALKERVLSRDIIFSPRTLLELKKAVEETLETDIDASSAAILLRTAISSRDSIASHVLSEDLLERPPYSPEYDNLYVFIPRDENWGEVHTWVECIFANKEGC